MRYRLEIEGTHVLRLDDSLDVDDVVQGYTAKITCDDADSEGTIAGNVEFFVVKVATAANNGISLTGAIDAITQDVYEYGAAVVDPETDDVRQDLLDRFECFGGDLMFLHIMKVLPAHRGRDVGLVAASRLIDCYANGLVVCRPQPLQTVGDRPAADDDGAMEYQRFSTDPREGKRKLQRHWARIGFEPITEDGIYALGTASTLPTVKLRTAASTARRAPRTKRKPRTR